MSQPSLPSFEDLSTNAQVRIDERCSAFEAACKVGPPPPLERYLGDTPEPERSVLLRELLLLEVRYHPNLADGPEPYVLRFPDHAALIRAVFRGEARTASRSTGPWPGPPSVLGVNGSASSSVALGPVDPEEEWVVKTIAGPDWSPPAEGDLGRLGDFELLTRLGAGGMGVVYKARQLSLKRDVALKVIRPDQLDGLPAEGRRDWLKRFVTEIHTTARLQHDHIVTVHGAGRAGGRLFYSMRYIEGRTLAELARQKPLPNQAAAALLEPVARAVHYAHTQGVLHRDLTPKNILVDQTQRPFVADFGLATWREGPADHKPGLGTLGYISPEQFDLVGQVTEASDVYSLGATLYHALTSRPPVQAAAVAGSLRQAVAGDLVTPRQFNPAIDRDLETITLKCLHHDPKQRYASAAELAEELCRYQKGEPIQARPISRAERLWRWARRHPLVAALTAALVLALLIAGISIVVGVVRVQQWQTEAKQERQSALQIKWDALLLKDDVLLLKEKDLRPSKRPDRRDLALDCLMQRVTLPVQRSPDSLAAQRSDWLYWLGQPSLRRGPSVRLPPELPPVGSPTLAAPAPDAGHALPLVSLGGVAPGAGPDQFRIVLRGRPLEMDLRTAQLTDVFGDADAFDAPSLLSPGGRFFLATTRDRRETRLWDLQQGTYLTLHDDQGKALVPDYVAFSPRSELLAAAAVRKADNPLRRTYTVFLYSVTHPEKPRALLGEFTAFGMDGLYLDPAGDLLAISAYGYEGGTSANAAHVLHLWSIPKRKPLGTLKLEEQSHTSHASDPRRVDFSPDSRLLVAVGSKGTIKLWHLPPDAARLPDEELPERVLWASSMAPRKIHSIRFFPDTQWFATVDTRGGLQLWDAHAGTMAAEGWLNDLTPGEPGARSPAPAALRLVSDNGPAQDGALHTWEFVPPAPRTFTAPRRDAQRPNPMLEFLFSPDERWLAWNVPAAPLLLDLRQPDAAPVPLPAPVGSIGVVAFSLESDRFFWAADQHQAAWPLPSLAPDYRPRPVPQPLEAMAVTRRGAKVVASLDKARKVTVYDLDTQEPLPLPMEIGPAEQGSRSTKLGGPLRLDRAGERLALLTREDKQPLLKVFDLTTQRTLLAARLPEASRCLAFAERGAVVAVGMSRQILVYDLRSGASRALPVRGDPVVALALDQSGTLLAAATAGPEGLVQLWDPASGELLATLPTGMSTLSRIALSPTGKWLVAGDLDGRARLWDLADLRRQLREVGLDWSSAPAAEKP